jgi:hypothetical protein
MRALALLSRTKAPRTLRGQRAKLETVIAKLKGNGFGFGKLNASGKCA